MFFRILKKDLKRKKTMNIIILLFITMAATFLSSSVNNLISISGAIDYFLDKANTSDFVIVSYDRQGEREKILNWAKKSSYVKDYEENESIAILKENIRIERDGKIESYQPTNTLVFQGQPQKYSQVLDKDGALIKVNPGEIAVPMVEKRKNNLNLGDKIILKIGDTEKTFKVAYFGKDSIFGSEMMSMKRAIINDKDFNDLSKEKKSNKQYIYSMITNDVFGLEKDFKAIVENAPFAFGEDLIEYCYILDMLLSAILILVSFCLILISFLILRFSIVFTLQEDYKEIGIMKAIGVKHYGIQRLYLFKYLIMSVFAAILGCIISFPLGDMLIQKVSDNILIENSKGNGFVNVGCSIFIVLLVITFCYRSTGKLKRFSAIDSIRGGTNGERYKGKSILKLNERKNMKTPIFMALNDIFSNYKSYLVLLFTFCIGTMLIVLPINAMNTLKGGNTVKLFGIAHSDFFVDTGNLDEFVAKGDKGYYLKQIEELKKSFTNNGVPVDIYGQNLFKITFYLDSKEDRYSLLTAQSVNYDESGYSFIEGSVPRLENEVALTKMTAEKIGVSIGDTIYANIDGEKKSFVITGLCQNMMNMGQGARMNNKIEISYKNMDGINSFQGNFKGNVDKEQLIKKLKELYPNYRIFTSDKFMIDSIGSIVNQINSLKDLILLIVLGINGLITILTMKTFIEKEKGEIAMLKSLGFRNSSLRLWQMFRILIVLVFSIFIGVILSKVFGPFTIGKIFNFMGASNIDIIINPIEVYIIYPLILLGITGIIGYFSSRAVKYVDLKEINNIE